MILTHERAGRGESVVLVHGLGSARTTWKPVTPALAASFDVIAVDLPGHGRTPWVKGTAMAPRSLAAAVVDTLDHLGVHQKVHLVGNSLGGWTCLELAAAHPERVASIVALAPAGMRDTPLAKIGLDFKINRYLSVAARPLLPFLLGNERLRAIGFAQNSPVWKQWSLETCRDAADAMALSGGYHAALDGILGRLADCTKKIPASIPLTIVFGDTDVILPKSTSQSRRHVPAHARWLDWERCGHAVQLDYPERVVDLVKEVAGAAVRPPAGATAPDRQA